MSDHGPNWEIVDELPDAYCDICGVHLSKTLGSASWENNVVCLGCIAEMDPDYDSPAPPEKSERHIKGQTK